MRFPFTQPEHSGRRTMSCRFAHGAGDLDLGSGSYAFICSLPDITAEGAPHFTRGMLQEVTIPATAET